MDETYKLFIDLNNQSDADLMQNLINFRLPVLSSIVIYRHKDDGNPINESIKEFLVHSHSDITQHLSLLSKSDSEEKKDRIADYLEGFES